jgi:CDP-glucose 4,6-dehydratase
VEQRQSAVESLVMFAGYYQDRRVLVTGHTGFKGAWLSLWLKQLGAEVHGFSLPAPTNPNLHEIIRATTFASETEGDVRNSAVLTAAIKKIQPQVIFHLAAQALVRRSYAEPLDTFETNALGTAHVLEAVRQLELNCLTVVITSDKCYENRELDYDYREGDSLGGHDIYSMSKGATELVAQSWQRSFFAPNPKLGSIVTARAGNVIGGGDYAADRIVPDCIRALIAKKPISVRNPRAVRPWQHVLECLSGYLWLAARVSHEPKTSNLISPFNFGPGRSSRQPVGKLVEEILRSWPGEWTDSSDPAAPHEAKLLSLSIEKAGALLGWKPTWDFDEAIRRTVSWYRERHDLNNADMLRFSRSQIDDYTAAARNKKLSWTKPA